MYPQLTMTVDDRRRCNIGLGLKIKIRSALCVDVSTDETTLFWID